MRVTFFVACVLSCLAFVDVDAAESAGPPTVQIRSIVEKRELSLAQDKDPFAGWNNNIEINFHIDGDAVKGARSYGHLKIKSATDDAGTDLTQKGQGPSYAMKGMEEIREPMVFGNSRHEEKPKPTGFEFKLTLPTPSARAAKTFSCSATIDVIAGGEKKIVAVKDIKSHLGKPVQDPALKAVGVHFELVDPANRKSMGVLVSGNGDNTVSAIISGKIDALASVRIVNAAGKKLNNSSTWSDDGGSRSIFYICNDPIPSDAVLELEVWPGQKTITIPIEIKNQALP